jgi:aryl-phospho-beta-D-glucosidase BglC (GH1 family)
LAHYRLAPATHKQILSKDGIDLFHRNHLPQARALKKRFLPGSYGNDKNKIRGVNLGSMFVLENWLATNVMAGWGCNPLSEFDCVSSLNDQAKANADFQSHWQTWVTADDFTQMVQYGLNTVRIGVGYWMMEDLVADTENFPQGGEEYLDRVVGYVKEHFQEHLSSS